MSLLLQEGEGEKTLFKKQEGLTAGLPESPIPGDGHKLGRQPCRENKHERKPYGKSWETTM